MAQPSLASMGLGRPGAPASAPVPNAACRPQRPTRGCGCRRPQTVAAATSSPWRPRLPAAALSAALLLLGPSAAPLLPPPAHAELVRLEDVKSADTRAGVRAVEAGDLVLAERLFRQGTAREPLSASAWSNLGNAVLQRGRPQEAVEAFTTAVQLAPQAPVPLLNRAIALEALGRYTEALADCDAAIARDDRESAAWFNRGNVLGRLGDWAAAAESYTRAADLSPGLSGYRFKQAAALYEADGGDDGPVLRLLSGIVRKNPTYAEAHAALAAVYWARGEAARAEAAFAGADSPPWGDTSLREARTYGPDALRWGPRLTADIQAFLRLEPRLGAEGPPPG